jgi:hypothetical protein
MEETINMAQRKDNIMSNETQKKGGHEQQGILYKR